MILCLHFRRYRYCCRCLFERLRFRKRFPSGRVGCTSYFTQRFKLIRRLRSGDCCFSVQLGLGLWFHWHLHTPFPLPSRRTPNLTQRSELIRRLRFGGLFRPRLLSRCRGSLGAIRSAGFDFLRSGVYWVVGEYSAIAPCKLLI